MQSGKNAPEAREVQTLLVVAATRGHLLFAFEAALKKLSYQVLTIPADINAYTGIKEPVSGLLLHVEETLLEHQDVLLFLKDRVVAEDIPFFILGTRKHIDELRPILPSDIICQEFVRPISIHVNLLAERIDTNIRQNNVKKKILGGG